MTAEIAILNRQAVALAADSAVTIGAPGRQKIFTSANKIFAISHHHPVGLLIFGNAGIMNVPWDTVIKMHRSALQEKTFASLDGYAAHFFEWLLQERARLFPSDAEEQHVVGVAAHYLQDVREEIDSRVEQRIDEKGKVTDPEVASIVGAVVDDRYNAVMGADRMPAVPRGFLARIRRKYRRMIDSAIDAQLQGHSLPITTRRELHTLAVNLFIRAVPDYEPPFLSGIVFAGFGDDDVFPALRPFLIEGIVDGYIKKHEMDELQIESVGTTASIRAFAQGEMVVRFMEGVDPEYQQFVEQFFVSVLGQYPDLLLQGMKGIAPSVRARLRKRGETLAQRSLAHIQASLAEVRRDKFTSPVTNLVDSLPKDELAEMAESLVNLTSFKRRVSFEDETVGGPIDVAVISKGDGFVWIKRKHYFPADLNPHYFSSRFRSSGI